MTAEARTIRTEAEKSIAETFEAIHAGLPGGADVRARRDAAFDVFRRTGLPHRRIEEWKYTDLRTLVRKAAKPTSPPDEETVRAALTALRDPLAGVDRYRLVLADGYFMAGLSDTDALEDAGVSVQTAANVLTHDAPGILDAPGMAAADIAVALNAAFVTDGVDITIHDRTLLERPIQIVHIMTGPGAATVRSSVHVGAEANARIVETYQGPDGADYQVNAVTAVTIEEGARARYARVQAEGDAALHIGTTFMSLSPRAEIDHLTVTAGAAISRQQTFLSTGGSHARAGLHGAGMMAGKQHADVTLLIDHALPGANTRVLFKSVADGEARGVFQGKIVVEPDAQKTDAKMMSQALLLSEGAEFDSKPELEIFADDVQCGHGSTAGRIDADQLFYLMARGVPRGEAERLLIEAFLDAAIDALGDEEIGAALKNVVSRWLEKRGGAS